jgi:hypothetical protein
MNARTWILLGAAAVGAVAFSLWADHGDGKRVRPKAADAEALPTRAPAPERARPSFDEAVALMPAREAHEQRSAPVVNGVVQIGPRALGPGAASPPAADHQSGGAWATSYAVAMCDCRTRACAADLQGRFIHAMGGIEYDAERDLATYEAAMKRAVDCYVALPEDS